MKSRLMRIVLCCVLMSGLAIPPVAASDEVAFPQSRAEWEAMTPEARANLMEQQLAKLNALLASGQAEIHTAYGLSSQSDPANPAALLPEDLSALAVTVSRNCYVQWIILPGEGDWVRGGGWTSASNEVDTIWAGRSGKPGKFYRDGQWKGDWYQQRWPGSYAERQTGYHWAFWWEYVHWTTQGWHGAYDNGVYLMNDSYCFAQKWL